MDFASMITYMGGRGIDFLINPSQIAFKSMQVIKATGVQYTVYEILCAVYCATKSHNNMYKKDHIVHNYCGQ